MKNKELPNDLKTARRITYESVNYFLDDTGILWHVKRKSKGLQLVIPAEYRQDILKKFHDEANHMRNPKFYLTLMNFVFFGKTCA